MRFKAIVKRLSLFSISIVLCLVMLPPSISYANDEASCDFDYSSGNNIYFFNPCDDTCKVTQGTVTSVNGDDNREKIYNYLRAKGLSPEQAAGVTGNIQHESGFSPTRQEMSQTFPEGGWGLVQWTFGRRSDSDPNKGVVAYLNQKIPSVMEKYYTAEFGGGVNETSGFVPSGMDVKDNDSLLLHELDFLYKESSTGRSISPKTAGLIEGLTAGDNEWESLKKAPSLQVASDIWLYNFEIPADMESKSAARAASGQTILDLYSGAGQNIGCEDQNGDLRTRIVNAAEKEYSRWQSGEMSPGESFLEYTYGIHGDWCAWFVSWVYKNANYPVKEGDNPYYSYVSEFTELGQAGDKFEWNPNDGSYVPRPGDIAIYGDASRQFHTNIVISAKSSTVVTTIGGNERGGNDDSDFKYRSGVIKNEDGTYWPSVAYGYVSPKE